MRLKDIFHGKENKQHPFYVKSTWEPTVQQSVALETFLEEVKFELVNSPSKRPKDNLSPGEMRALQPIRWQNHYQGAENKKLKRVKFCWTIWITTAP